MYWIEDIQKALGYIEENILADISHENVLKNLPSSSDCLRKTFSIITGFSISEYIRNRRMSLAGEDLFKGDITIADAAKKYHYTTPDSFNKAFSRFHGFSPKDEGIPQERYKIFSPILTQLRINGGFDMSVKLDSRNIGLTANLSSGMRAPESFAFPACLTSLMEHIGEDAKRETIKAHNREYTRRHLYDDILAATGMSFGLLWHKSNLYQSLDLMQVNNNRLKTIKLGFDLVGYDFELVEKTENNFDEMKLLLTESINFGIPALAFGLAGSPECSIICGYDSGGDALFGLSHVGSHNQTSSEGGMFRVADWHKSVFGILLCKGKKEPSKNLEHIVRRGLAIAQANELSGCLSGRAAYNAWFEYITDPVCESLNDDKLRDKYRFHDTLIGNHAESRAYLAAFLHMSANGDNDLHEIAALYSEIHDTCWKIRKSFGGSKNSDAYKSLREKAKREDAAALIRLIEGFDFLAAEKLEAWLGKRGG